ncbi:lysophospholipid transporter LplT [Curvibacter sp. CHRR-16]|uniref:lysophospholipid transporter LplT n=1 Tax=Curvibacter sp. CHRR-16 TaxID=2835872 RepID=UPI001BDADA62|nr:lysophospholipid transporter LplT [Curvibacter sp. CHRR-16]MBT0570116.1 lysophospholipid transporter LplT [Curvibacter sp. CHRR-16]
MPNRSFYVLMGAQFLSALADNALLIVCIALLRQQQWDWWWIPLLRVFFTVSYVMLAPWVGLVADKLHKPRVMRWANAAKLAGCALLLAGVHVPSAYALVGLGAALYAPAKYGWITDAMLPQRLVWANGWIEVSTVSAAVLGVGLGGVLLLAPTSMALWGLLATYGVAWALCHGIATVQRDGMPVLPHGWDAWRKPFTAFAADCWALWRDPLSRLSLAVTTLFWGVGAVVQLLVLQWAEQQLHLPLSQGAYLQGCAAVGVVLGAVLAARWVRLEQAQRVLLLGVVLGALMPLLHWVHSVGWAVAMTLLVGVISGLFVVPMNALLQHRGAQLLTSGRSIAVQNFHENCSILLQSGAYALLLAAGLPLGSMLLLFGGFVVVAMLLIGWRLRVR